MQDLAPCRLLCTMHMQCAELYIKNSLCFVLYCATLTHIIQVWNLVLPCHNSHFRPFSTVLYYHNSHFRQLCIVLYCHNSHSSVLHCIDTIHMSYNSALYSPFISVHIAVHRVELCCAHDALYVYSRFPSVGCRQAGMRWPAGFIPSHFKITFIKTSHHKAGTGHLPRG